MPVSNETVSTTIVLATRAPAAASFGTPAVFCKTPYVGARTYELSQEGLSQMVTDGFALTSRGYSLVSSMASQSPHTTNVVVYGRAALSTCVLNWTPIVLTLGTVFNFDLTYKGISANINYVAGGSETATTVVTAVRALVTASAPGVAGAVASGTTAMILTGGTTSEPVQISNQNPAIAAILDTTADAGIATDLAAAAIAPNPSFYRFVIDTYSPLENAAAAAWAEANNNRFFAHTADSTNVTSAVGAGIGQVMFAALYNRSACVHNGDMKQNAAACLVARQAAFDPGTSSYAYKQLTGPAADALTGTQIANAKGKNILVYALNSASAQTWYGRAPSGRSLRIQDALDLLDSRIREAILTVFLSNEYVPMSDPGFAMIEGAVRSVLSSFQASGVITPGFTVTVPKVATISSADKIAGRLPNLKFGCTMPNDMLLVSVNGTVAF